MSKPTKKEVVDFLTGWIETDMREIGDDRESDYAKWVLSNNRRIQGAIDMLTESVCCPICGATIEKQSIMQQERQGPKIYAVDFDGYLCENKYPDIGKPNVSVIDYFKLLHALGNKLILWTCREGERLYEAIEWCQRCGLYFDAYNENLPSMRARYGNDCRKVGADYYCDDRNYYLPKELCR